ncbi:MAG: VOC family protein [Pseudomonadota bacterium]
MTVTVKRLDHVNVRTSRLDEMIHWYGEMLGMRSGPRPDFPFPGAWLYCGKDAAIHLIGVEAEPGSDAEDLKLEHFALAATGIAELVERAKASGERFDIRKVPDFPIVQVNLWDPDGNHIHIDFHADEAEAAGF